MIIQEQIINKTALPLFKRLLHLVSSSQKVVADNVAHVSTPGYKSKSIDFKREMEAVLKKNRLQVQTTNPRHLPPPDHPKPIKVLTGTGEPNASGVNDVDIDKEMATLAENQILYDFGAKMAARNFSTLRNVIRGRT